MLPEPSIGKLLVGPRGRALELQHMSFGNRVVASLADALPLMDPERVGLKDNRLTDKGIAALAAGLARCENLEEIDLSINAMRRNAAMAVASTVRAIRTRLRVLNLEGCGLSSSSVATVSSISITDKWLSVAL